MSNPLIRDCDHYLVLEPARNERILTVEETLSWLEEWLGKFNNWPEDLQTELSSSSAAKRLLDTACDLEIEPGLRIQWFAVRIEHPEH